MKKFFVIGLLTFSILAIAAAGVFYYRERALVSLTKDIQKIRIYKSWGYETAPFETLYTSYLSDTKSIPFILFPFQKKSIEEKHDTILRLAQAGYATEITKQKGAIQAKLTYLRERVKTLSVLPQATKQAYFDSFEVTAGEIFETNSDLTSIQRHLALLDMQDASITAQAEKIRTETIQSEVRAYKQTCSELYGFFTSKQSDENINLAASCINEADTVLRSQNRDGAAEQVFTSLQKAQTAKQNLLQAELYAAEAKRKEEEKLTLVPPAPRQEGKIILVNLSLQRLYAYENGKSIFEAAVPITTGKYGFETVTGEFAIYVKKVQHQMVSPFPGIYYDDVVNYWMPFYLGYGLHDAPWRAVYGTQDYPIVGSHGCVNMPLKYTIVLYNWAEVGTRVIVI